MTKQGWGSGTFKWTMPNTTTGLIENRGKDDPVNARFKNRAKIELK